MITRATGLLSGLVISTSAVLALASVAGADLPAAMITIGAGGADPLAMLQEADELPSGALLFSGSIAAADGQWSSGWNYTDDLDPDGNAMLTGLIWIKNLSSAPIEFHVEVAAPLCPGILDETLIGGSASVKLTANADGGSITSGSRENLWRIMTDTTGTDVIFAGDFLLSSTGAGTAVTSGSFGLPMPSMSAPPATATFGTRHNFVLTPGDKATLTALLVMGGDPANFVECGGERVGPPLDFNSDGVVDGSDMVMVFAQWGPVMPGKASEVDLNGDGVVDAADLAILIVEWKSL